MEVEVRLGPSTHPKIPDLTSRKKPIASLSDRNKPPAQGKGQRGQVETDYAATEKATRRRRRLSKGRGTREESQRRRVRKRTARSGGNPDGRRLRQEVGRQRRLQAGRRGGLQ
ncbi:hypothetical protein CFC21_077191 [Triticum aestivum]|uniref:Uncharacterized protein n=2 Tax=Triticum aestivum TaxID=4565 RepID=A0A9R1HVT2_WHEAT|nr:hypothetical protein CFC21_077190 [Triticum aestivum]KAF7071987.1 hypothetical protein CFC21_077191 [Triticum aestivum]